MPPQGHVLNAEDKCRFVRGYDEVWVRLQGYIEAKTYPERTRNVMLNIEVTMTPPSIRGANGCPFVAGIDGYRGR